MLIGDVVGRLWASRQASGLAGEKLLLVRPVAADGQATARLVVAVDRLGAGEGERVVVAHGSRVRDLTVGVVVPDKDIVIGIVDGADITPAFAQPRAQAHGQPQQGQGRRQRQKDDRP
jgi:ethanolamine utilization protein EutN